MYEAVDAALLRLAASPAEPPGTWPDVATWPTADLVGWLRAVSAAPGFTDAVEVASPVLADRISRMCGCPDPGRRDVQRVVQATVKYVLRARTRATPFGLFAGVAPLRLGARSAVRMGDDGHHVHARVDASWTAAVLERLHRDRRLVRRLPVTITDLAVVRDGRLILPNRSSTRSGPNPHSGASTRGSVGPGGRRRAPMSSAGVTQETSVRLTPAVAAVMELAPVPVPFTRLSDQLAEGFRAPVAVVEAMLFELVDHQLLLTALHAPMTVTDPLTHLVDVLSAAADTADLADAARDGLSLGDDASAVLVALRDTAALLVEHDRTDAATRRRDLRVRAADRMRAVAATDRQVGVDLRLELDVVLPAAVGAEAARAAEVMTRLARPADTGTPWGDYHRRFLDRYGPGAVVAVQDLLHGSDGLGYPAGYRDSTLPRPTGRPSAQSVRRDAALLDLAHRAAWDRLGEVYLVEADLTDLTAASEDGAPVVEYAPARPHAEIRAEVHAGSCAAVDRGEFTLAVLSVSRGVGTVTGRFLDLLDPRDQDRMRAAYADLPTLTTGALRAQVSCPPITASATTISRTPLLLPASIALGQPPVGRDPGERIPLTDLAVSADARGCYLVSVSRNRAIEPHLFGAVELVRVAHPTLRFLAEISTAAAPVLTPFAWGPARELPYLPRIRHGRTVLAPARWRLHAADLVGRGNLPAWRQQSGVPDQVLLGDDDRRLRLDLTEPAHRDVLLDQVHRTGAVTVLEAPPDDAFGWIDHRPHEIVLPLAATARAPHPARPRPTAVATGRLALDQAATAGHWLSARLFGRPEQLTRVLVDHLAALIDTLAGAHPRHGPDPWFLRHSDPEQHLRVRVPLSAPDVFGGTAEAIRTWSAPLVESGLLGRLEFDTYRAETGRFGNDAAMDAAHAVFAADSAAALTQLRLTGQHRPAGPDRAAGPDRTATTAAGLFDLVIAFTGDATEGRRWLLDHVPRGGARVLGERGNRTTPADTLALVGPHLRTLAGGADVAAAWQRRAHALAAYRTALERRGVDDPNVVLPDLLHLHHARTIGLSLESEHRCLHRARGAALSQLHQRVP